ncbi:hypothetical protein Hanom_Chr00s000006g01614411 [Helianthus anomalus]
MTLRQKYIQIMKGIVVHVMTTYLISIVVLDGRLEISDMTAKRRDMSFKVRFYRFSPKYQI